MEELKSFIYKTTGEFSLSFSYLIASSNYGKEDSHCLIYNRSAHLDILTMFVQLPNGAFEYSILFLRRSFVHILSD